MSLMGFEGAVLLVIMVSALIALKSGRIIKDANALVAVSCVFLAALIVLPLTMTLRALLSMLFAVFALTAAVSAVIDAARDKEDDR